MSRRVVVRLEAIVEAELSDFDRDNFTASLAAFLRIPSQRIALSVTPASIRVTATIEVPDDASATDILAALKPLEKSHATASSVLRIELVVTSVSVDILSIEPPLAPPPPAKPPTSPPPDDSGLTTDSGQLSIGVLAAIIGGGVGLVACACLVLLFYCHRRRGRAAFRTQANGPSRPTFLQDARHHHFGSSTNRKRADEGFASILTGHQQQYQPEVAYQKATLSGGPLQSGPFGFYPSEISSRSDKSINLTPDRAAVHTDEDLGSNHTSGMPGTTSPDGRVAYF